MTNQHDTVLYIGMTNDLSGESASIDPAKRRDSLQIFNVTNSSITSILLKSKRRLRAKNS